MNRAWQVVGASVEQRSSQVFARLLDGETVREVAAQFGMSEQAVHKIKQRVRDRLREQIDLQIREEDGVAS
jgi:DNA-directed RNA polymerase specialized sigma24 family protein